MNSGYRGGSQARAAQAPKPGAPMKVAAVPGTRAIKKKKKVASMRSQLAANLMQAV